MRGVDISNRMISDYELDSKTVKWGKRIFFHLLDLALVNSWILYKNNISQLDFRLSIIQHVKGKFGLSRKITQEKHFPVKQDKRSTCVNCIKRRKSFVHTKDTRKLQLQFIHAHHVEFICSSNDYH